MSRRPLVIAILALLAVALLVPIVLLALAGRPATGEPAAHTSASAELVAAGPLRPDQVGWVYAPMAVAPPRPSYTLQAGTLAHAGPALDFEVAWAADPTVHLGREPAVGPIIGGAVVYVEDDGARSTVRRAEARPGGMNERLAELPEIVWSMAVAPDGRSAFLALVDRENFETDLGIARLALDGSGELERVMDPMPVANSRPDVVLAAFISFDVDLSVSADGRHLLRRGCQGAAGCRLDVLDVATGAVTDQGQRELIGAAGGILLVQGCDMANCWVEAIDLSSGASQRLGAKVLQATITVVDGRAIIPFIDGDDAGGLVLRALDPIDGRVSDVLRPPRGSGVMLDPFVHGLKLSMPEGHLLIAVPGEAIGAVVAERNLAVPLRGGEPVELPEVPFRPVEPPGPRG